LEKLLVLSWAVAFFFSELRLLVFADFVLLDVGVQVR